MVKYIYFLCKYYSLNNIMDIVDCVWLFSVIGIWVGNLIGL